MAGRSNNAFEGDKALQSMAGWFITRQANESVSGTSAGSYTVQDNDTRRVAFIVIGTTDGDVRFAHLDGEDKAAADANDMPLPDGVWMILDLRKDEVLGLYNTTGSTITVNIAELR